MVFFALISHSLHNFINTGLFLICLPQFQNSLISLVSSHVSVVLSCFAGVMSLQCISQEIQPFQHHNISSLWRFSCNRLAIASSKNAVLCYAGFSKGITYGMLLTCIVQQIWEDGRLAFLDGAGVQKHFSNIICCPRLFTAVSMKEAASSKGCLWMFGNVATMRYHHLINPSDIALFKRINQLFDAISNEFVFFYSYLFFLVDSGFEAEKACIVESCWFDQHFTPILILFHDIVSFKFHSIKFHIIFFKVFTAN